MLDTLLSNHTLENNHDQVLLKTNKLNEIKNKWNDLI